MMDTKELAEHVQDGHSFHVPRFMGGHWDLPAFDVNILGLQYHFQLTKFMVLELVAAVILIALFVPVARRASRGQPPRGRLWNLLEAMVLFVRDDIVRPTIGGKQADRFLPFILTLFFFILICNLLGMIPWAGSPTGNLAVTGTLAIASFLTATVAGMRTFGPIGYFWGLVPHMKMPLAMAIFIIPLILLLEIVGLGIKNFVLAIRLLANMFAGHLVLAVLVGFIGAAATQHVAVWSGVTVASILGAIAISLLELFVALLQAYIFAILTALFIGMAVHKH